MAHPDRGMFSSKLIRPNHLNHPYFTSDFDGTDGRWTLMNFSSDGKSPSIAANIPIGHRAIVYLMHQHKLIWAIKYIGTVAEGRLAAIANGIQPNEITTKWNIFRPIQILAGVDPKSAPTAEDIRQRTGVDFTPNQFPMKNISEEDYLKVFNSINRHWKAPSEQVGVCVSSVSPNSLF